MTATRKKPLQRNFLKVFDQLCKCMRLDYIDNALFQVSDYGKYEGLLEKLNPSMFQSRLICDRTLTQMMLEYLCWYNDPAIRLVIGGGSAWQPFSLGYDVQRHGDSLYVTEVTDEKRLVPGDRIVKLNRSTLDDIHEEVERTLFSVSDPDREDWTIALGYAKHIGVVHADGAEEELEVERYAVPALAEKAPSLAILTQDDLDRACGHLGGTARSGGKLPAGRVGLLTLGSPATPGFASAIDVLAPSLSELDALVIDARGTRGGASEAACALLPWVLDEATPYRKVFGDPGLIINWSRRNAIAKEDELKGVLASWGDVPADAEADAHAQERSMVSDLIAEVENDRGKGIVVEEEHGFDDVTFIPAKQAPSRVVILADRHTGEAAEMLVRAAAASNKATVVGRATLGSLDNTCLRAVDLDQDFRLVFPTGKFIEARDGVSTRTHGIAPDISIPWIPDFISSDVDLREAVRSLA